MRLHSETTVLKQIYYILLKNKYRSFNFVVVVVCWFFICLFIAVTQMSPIAVLFVTMKSLILLFCIFYCVTSSSNPGH